MSQQCKALNTVVEMFFFDASRESHCQVAYNKLETAENDLNFFKKTQLLKKMLTSQIILLSKDSAGIFQRDGHAMSLRRNACEIFAELAIFFGFASFLFTKL